MVLLGLQHQQQKRIPGIQSLMEPNGNKPLLLLRDCGGIKPCNVFKSDGINWTAAAATKINVWYEVTYGDGKFVAVANSGTTNQLMYSTDGDNWTPATLQKLSKFQLVLSCLWQ